MTSAPGQAGGPHRQGRARPRPRGRRRRWPRPSQPMRCSGASSSSIAASSASAPSHRAGRGEDHHQGRAAPGRPGRRAHGGARLARRRRAGPAPADSPPRIARCRSLRSIIAHPARPRPTRRPAGRQTSCSGGIGSRGSSRARASSSRSAGHQQLARAAGQHVRHVDRGAPHQARGCPARRSRPTSISASGWWRAKATCTHCAPARAAAARAGGRGRISRRRSHGRRGRRRLAAADEEGLDEERLRPRSRRCGPGRRRLRPPTSAESPR